MTHSQNIINCFNTTLKVIKTWDYPAGNYMFKVNNRNTRIRCELCSKLTIKRPERRRIYDPLKYLWWKVFAKFPISGFNLLIVSGTFQPFLACYELLPVVPFFISKTSQNVLTSKFTINQVHVDFIAKDCQRYYRVEQLKVG